MVYAYNGPEVARLKNYRFQVQEEHDKYARRVRKDTVIAIGSAAVFAASVAAGFGLGFYLEAHGPLNFAPENPVGLTLVGLSFVPLLSFYTGLGATAFLLYNQIRVEGKKASIAQVSEDIKKAEKGTLQ